MVGHSQLCQEKALPTTGLTQARGTAGPYSHISWDMDLLTSEQALPQDHLGPGHDHQQANTSSKVPWIIQAAKMISRPTQEQADTILGTTQTPQPAISEMGIGNQQGDTGSGTLAL